MSSKELSDELDRLIKYYDPDNEAERVLKALAFKLDTVIAAINARLDQLEKK